MFKVIDVLLVSFIGSEGDGISEFWVLGGNQNIFDLKGKGEGCPMRGWGLYFVGEGHFILHPFSSIFSF